MASLYMSAMYVISGTVVTKFVRICIPLQGLIQVFNLQFLSFISVALVYKSQDFLSGKRKSQDLSGDQTHTLTSPV